MEEIKELRKSIEEYLKTKFLKAPIDAWEDSWGSSFEYKSPEDKIFIVFKYKDKRIRLSLYLHKTKEDVQRSRENHVQGIVYQKHFILRKICFGFNYKARRKYFNIKSYYKNKKEYIEVKNAFDSLPVSYKRKQKLEKIEENGN